MRITAWDSAFVRARRADFHPVLADVASYGRWWPGVQSRGTGDGALLSIRPPGILRARQRITVAITKERPGKGVRMRYSGDLDGEAEWYYLDEPAGAVVHYLLNVRVADRGWRRRLADHRAAVRAALDTVKDRFEAGRIPGSEPDAALLADQRAAIARFQADVEAHARSQQPSGGS